MFGLFKRKRKVRDIEDWELFLMYNTLEKLPDEFKTLKVQIEEELFAYATTGASSFDPDFVGFGFSDSIGEYENRRAREYEITNIKVLDINSNKRLDYSINVCSGVISGYSLKGAENPTIDISDIDVSAYEKRYYDNPDYDKLEKILSPAEISLINASEVHEVSLDGKVYFHIKDLEDGDFIGIDSEKIIYKITHDPYEITPLRESLETVLNG